MKLFNPEPTDDTVLNRVQRKIAEAIERIVNILDAGVVSAPAVVVSGTYQIRAEACIVYNGSGGHKITLPPASGLTGRTRQVCLINTGVGFNFQLTPSGSDTINGRSTPIPVAAGTMTIVVSDGAGKWKCDVPYFTFDLARGEVGLFDNLNFIASADTHNNTTARFIHYTLNYAGRAVPSNIVGLAITATETDMGTSAPAHSPFLIAVNNVDLLHLTAIKGATHALMKLSCDLQVTQDTRLNGNIGEYGAAAVPQSAHIPHATDLASAITAINSLLTYFEGRGTVAP